MTDENSFLVPWVPAVIPAGAEPYPAGGTWADPDLDAAARLMRSVIEDPAGAAARGARAASDVATLHSPAVAGRQIAVRLKESAGRRRATSLRTLSRRLRTSDRAARTAFESPCRTRTGLGCCWPYDRVCATGRPLPLLRAEPRGRRAVASARRPGGRPLRRGRRQPPPGRLGHQGLLRPRVGRHHHRTGARVRPGTPGRAAARHHDRGRDHRRGRRLRRPARDRRDRPVHHRGLGGNPARRDRRRGRRQDGPRAAAVGRPRAERGPGPRDPLHARGHRGVGAAGPRQCRPPGLPALGAGHRVHRPQLLDPDSPRLGTLGPRCGLRLLPVRRHLPLLRRSRARRSASGHAVLPGLCAGPVRRGTRLLGLAGPGEPEGGRPALACRGPDAMGRGQPVQHRRGALGGAGAGSRPTRARCRASEPVLAGHRTAPCRAQPAGSSVKGGTTDSLAALNQRLRAVADVLLDDVPAPRDDPADEAADLLSALVAIARHSLRADHAWILYTAVSGHLPLPADVQDLLRWFELCASAADAEIGLLHRARSVIAVHGEAGGALKVVADAVIVDVTFSSQNDKHTGIQRVTREVCPRWDAAHEITLAAWSPSQSTLRTLRPDERKRVLAWTSRPRDTRPEPAAAPE